jgi:acyl-CoA thioester hydrolase
MVGYNNINKFYFNWQAMDSYVLPIEIRWADLDPNFHLRHSVYYDYGAASRISFLQREGITATFMNEHAFGPIIFREECIFKKEIRLQDIISIDLKLQKATKDLSRWTIQHTIFKNDQVRSAVLTVDGAWLDLVKRKLTLPPELVCETFNKMPRTEDFQWITKS